MDLINKAAHLRLCIRVRAWPAQVFRSQIKYLDTIVTTVAGVEESIAADTGTV